MQALFVSAVSLSADGNMLAVEALNESSDATSQLERPASNLQWTFDGHNSQTLDGPGPNNSRIRAPELREKKIPDVCFHHWFH